MANHYTVMSGKSLPMEATVNVEGVADPRANAKAWFMVKKSLRDADADALISKTSDPEGGIEAALEAGAAVYTWVLSPEETASVPDDLLGEIVHWAFDYKSAAGHVETIRQGTLRIKPSVVRGTV